MRRRNVVRSAIIVLLPLSFWLGDLLPVRQAQEAPRNAGFEQSVQPFLATHCYGCHNAEMKTGGLNLEAYPTAASVIQDREKWEDVLRKIRTGEMPPKGMPRPKEADVQTVVLWLDHLFEQADRQARPDPGRVTARRLNRREYANTVRDLLGVEFSADKEFPSTAGGQ
jgi:mono/diheme cytochrome c family protein